MNQETNQKINNIIEKSDEFWIWSTNMKLDDLERMYIKSLQDFLPDECILEILTYPYFKEINDKGEWITCKTYDGLLPSLEKFGAKSITYDIVPSKIPTDPTRKDLLIKCVMNRDKAISFLHCEPMVEFSFKSGRSKWNNMPLGEWLAVVRCSDVGSEDYWINRQLAPIKKDITCQHHIIVWRGDDPCPLFFWVPNPNIKQNCIATIIKEVRLMGFVVKHTKYNE